MPDQKISELNEIVTVDNAADLFPIVDTSASETKKITPTALKTALSLNNVDNTSDADKPISTATQTALNLKADSSTVSTHIANTNNPHEVTKSQVGLGNVDNTSDVNKPISTATQTALNAKQDSLGFTAENVANKSTSVDTDKLSNTKYPSVKSVYDWAVGLFATIANLALKTDKLIVTNRQTASYTLVLSDADKLVEMNVATANNLTIPLNSSVAFSVGTQILLAQYGSGQTTIVPTSGVTVRSNGGKLKLNAQYSGATLIKIANDEWYLFGDITA